MHDRPPTRAMLRAIAATNRAGILPPNIRIAGPTLLRLRADGLLWTERRRVFADRVRLTDAGMVWKRREQWAAIERIDAARAATHADVAVAGAQLAVDIAFDVSTG